MHVWIWLNQEQSIKQSLRKTWRLRAAASLGPGYWVQGGGHRGQKQFLLQRSPGPPTQLQSANMISRESGFAQWVHVTLSAPYTAVTGAHIIPFSSLNQSPTVISIAHLVGLHAGTLQHHRDMLPWQANAADSICPIAVAGEGSRAGPGSFPHHTIHSFRRNGRLFCC